MNTYDNVTPTRARSRPRSFVSWICDNATWPRTTPAGANTNANTTDNVANVFVSCCWEVGAGAPEGLVGPTVNGSLPNGSPLGAVPGPPPPSPPGFILTATRNSTWSSAPGPRSETGRYRGRAGGCHWAAARVTTPRSIGEPIAFRWTGFRLPQPSIPH